MVHEAGECIHLEFRNTTCSSPWFKSFAERIVVAQKSQVNSADPALMSDWVMVTQIRPCRNHKLLKKV
jgi:hypothetical protein